MRVRVEGTMGILLDFGLEDALLPLDIEERAQAFEALTGALALLAGVRPPKSASATEGVTDPHPSKSERCLCGHKDGDVVLLAERRAGGAPTPKPV